MAGVLWLERCLARERESPLALDDLSVSGVAEIWGSNRELAGNFGFAPATVTGSGLNQSARG